MADEWESSQSVRIRIFTHRLRLLPVRQDSQKLEYYSICCGKSLYNPDHWECSRTDCVSSLRAKDLKSQIATQFAVGNHCKTYYWECSRTDCVSSLCASLSGTAARCLVPVLLHHLVHAQSWRARAHVCVALGIIVNRHPRQLAAYLSAIVSCFFMYVAECCRVLWRVAECCGVLQNVAECCRCAAAERWGAGVEYHFQEI